MTSMCWAHEILDVEPSFVKQLLDRLDSGESLAKDPGEGAIKAIVNQSQTAGQVARALNISISQVRRLCRQYDIPYPYQRIHQEDEE